MEPELRKMLGDAVYEALKILASQEIAILLADQRMPAMTGSELCGEYIRGRLASLATVARSALLYRPRLNSSILRSSP